MIYISFDDGIDVILMEKIIVLMMKWKIVVVHNLRVHQEGVLRAVHNAVHKMCTSLRKSTFRHKSFLFQVLSTADNSEDAKMPVS